MAIKSRKRLVVDTCILRSAGDNEVAESIACRKALEAILNICHSIVLNNEIKTEYDKHRSNYSSLWLFAMNNKEKIIKAALDATKKKEFDKKINDALDDVTDKSIRDAIRKDLPFYNAALSTDKIILSRDDKMDKNYTTCLGAIPEIQSVTWKNPCKDKEGYIEWLRKAAKPKRQPTRIHHTNKK